MKKVALMFLLLINGLVQAEYITVLGINWSMTLNEMSQVLGERDNTFCSTLDISFMARRMGRENPEQYMTLHCEEGKNDYADIITSRTSIQVDSSRIYIPCTHINTCIE